MFHFYVLQWLVALLIIRVVVHAGLKNEYRMHSVSALGTPLFLAVGAFFYWILGSLIPVFSAAIQIVLAFTISCGLLFKINQCFFENCKQYFKQNGIEQALFWLTLLLSLYIRQFAPDLGSGEKYSDMAIFQAVLLENHFPPEDRWLSGYPLNYYYFSHLLFVPLVRLLGTPVEWASNLIVCTVPAFLVSTAYAFLREKQYKKHVAGLSVFLIFFAGNWEWVRWAMGWSKNKSVFWWWDSSRAIPSTITEFPYFSFLLGDMHAHYVSLAFVTVSFAYLLKLKDGFDQKRKQSKYFLYGIMPIIIGMHYMMNSWHLPFVFLMCGLCLWSYPKYLIMMLTLAAAYFTPFWLQYHPPENTIGLFYVKKSMRSPLRDFLLHWGPMFTLLTLAYVKRAFFEKANEISKYGWPKYLLFAGLSLGAIVGGTFVLGASPVFMLVLIALFISLGFLREVTAQWSAGLILLSLLTILGCEFISVDVTYGDKFYRMNTVFKFYYLAWWGLAISLPALLQKEQVFKFFWAKILTVCCIALSLYYPIKSSTQRLNERAGMKKTLDGMRLWSGIFPGHRQAIEWLEHNTAVNDVIWEVPGGGFSKYARMATFSGRPSVLGWLGHEQIWREGGFYLANDRLQEFKDINKNPSMTKVKKYIKTYNIQWIIVGSLERQDYSDELLFLLDRFPKVFNNANVIIYKSQ